MCGIAGIAYFKKQKTVNTTELKLMSTAIAHRGPDDEGIYISSQKDVGLVNRRLAIIDLSAHGHQPMHYLNRYVISFNGEIYNFGEIRKNLQKLGYKFESFGDTEVIMALYDKYKSNCLKYLRGMFAIAIYDTKEETLFLARDKIGKKPLKYILDDQKIVFASELKAILTLKRIIRKVDYNAINSYLVYGYVPSPMTGFMSIKKLEPGHFLQINLKNKQYEMKKYWDIDFSEKLDLSENEWTKKILDTLEESTKLRMISDVPIGAFLSGGVDSSGVVATMAKLSTKPIKTFTISFGDRDLDESVHAGRIAKLYKTDHHILKAKPQSVDLLPYLAKQFEEPFADGSGVVSYMVSKLAKKYVTVALNGDGGDENFAGYPNRYFRLKRDVDWQGVIQKSTALSGMLKHFPKASRFLEKAKMPLYMRFASYNTIFTPNQIPNYENYDDPYKIVKNIFENFKGRDLKDAGLLFDLKYFLPDQLLAKMDIASMAVSLEARSPLLDHKMIELAAKIPFNLKVKNGESKYILKKALEKIVPKQNLYRPKVGFTIPLHKWFSGKLNSYAEGILLSQNSLAKELFGEKKLKIMINDNNKTEDFGPRLWSLMSLTLWHKAYFS